MRCADRCIYICCLYIPSGSSDFVYESYITVLKNFFVKCNVALSDNIFILGDFNFPYVSWTPDVDNNRVLLPMNVASGIEQNMFDMFLCNDLSQVNNIRNCQDRLLDLVFVNFANDIALSRSYIPLIKVDPLHEPIDMKFDMNIDAVNLSESPIHTFRFRQLT